MVGTHKMKIDNLNFVAKRKFKTKEKYAIVM